MKKLTRMLLIHWHHYEKEVIDFEMINFLTGKTAAGKSTIIDALQLVLLGDTDGSFFNKAANSRSARTLKSYLYGELGDDGDTGFRYLRGDTRFTSYVALEFYDTQKNAPFVTGIVCDCYKDQNFDRKWFVLNGHGLPDGLFIDPDTSTPYTIPELKIFFKQQYGRKSSVYEFFETNKRYQEVTRGKFGQIKEKYRLLLKKAVPFSPISDITQFITESICDVKNDISVDQMQSDIRLYKQLERDAASTARRIESLSKIQALDEAYRRECNTYNTQEYIVCRAEQDEYGAAVTALQHEIQDKTARLDVLGREIENLLTEKQAASDRLQQLQQEYGSSDIVRREQTLSAELRQLQKEIDSISAAIATAAARLHTYAREWMSALPPLENDAELSASVRERIPAHRAALERMAQVDSETVLSYPIDEALETLLDLHSLVSGEYSRVEGVRTVLQTEQESLRKTIAALKSGIKPYRGNVASFRAMLEQKLSEQTGQRVEVPVLADLLEVRDPDWQNAIEGCLDAQRFCLLVPEEHYAAALHIYEQAKAEQGYYAIGLADIGSLKQNAVTPQAGSLAEEIESDSPDALLYARYLLGGVMKSDSVSELNRHRTAITRGCMLYRDYAARRLDPSCYATPFLGRNALKIQLEQNEADLQRTTARLDAVTGTLAHLKRAARLSVMNDNEAQSCKAAVARHGELLQLTAQRDARQQEYDALDLLYMQNMRDEIGRLRTAVADMEQPIQHRREESIRLDEQIKTLREIRIPEELAKAAAVQQKITHTFDADWITQTAEPRYQEEAAKPTASSLSLRERYTSAKAGTATRRDKHRRDRNNARSAYNQQYHMPYDVEREDNTEFADELHSLQDIRLPEYAAQIQTAKEKAYNQFSDSFLDKIRSSIQSVTDQLKELNESLRKHQFGTDRYRFEQKPRPEYRRYYDMIMDPIRLDTGGYNLMSELFNQKYQHEIAELFDMLILNEMDMSSEKRAEYEKNIRKFTDYKTYLVFDLVVINDHGEEQRLSRTLLKKSGGETQIPFYISLLASFSQVCRIRSRPPQDNTIRLIILDEAFSKMDGERIRESILLLRQFQLQAVFSAPPEKIADIAPLVDRNIAVYKDYRHSFTRHFDPQMIEQEQITEE